jgi:energy-coupling factor transporter ATP-binding protein EcfA2
MSDVLEFAGVSVVRGQATLLDDVSWEVEEGQRWVILGPNGAGKTTLLQLAAGRMHPTRGVAGVLGEVLGAVDVFELRRLQRLHPVPWHRLCVVCGPVHPGAEVEAALRAGAIRRDRGHQHAPETRDENALTAHGGGPLGLDGGGRHPHQVARCGEGDEEGLLAEVAPQREAVEVARDVVDVGEGAGDRVLQRGPGRPRVRGPQRKPHGRREFGHPVMLSR